MEEKQENVVEETTQQENPVKEEPKVDDTVEKIKVKKKPTMKKLSQDDEIIKVDMSKTLKTETDAVQKSGTNASDATVGESGDSESREKMVEEVRNTKEESNTVQDEETPVLEEITGEEVEEQIEEAVAEAEATGKQIPENIQ